MKLLGTTTSPYVRKVRIVAQAAGVPLTFVDTRTEAGAALLADRAPVGKIPVLLDGDTVLPDSSLIISWLWSRHADALRKAGFELDPARWDDRAQQVIVEGALDAAINRLYYRRDDFEERGYLARQRARAEKVLAHLDNTAKFTKPVGLGTLSLGCALDWIVFRDQFDLSRYAGLNNFRRAWSASGVGTGTEPAE
jgi:glutathione S-transferase